jgi:hypothetical protein
MKKKKKIYILSDGRIYFYSIFPFYKTSSILLSLNDSFSKNLTLNLISKQNKKHATI